MAKQLEPLTIATDWLRGYAQTCLPIDASFECSDEELLEKGITLLDVRQFFRTAQVTYADKLEGPGGYWMAEGLDCDGRKLRAELVVISESVTVRLLSIDIVESEDGDDAA